MGDELAQLGPASLQTLHVDHLDHRLNQLDKDGININCINSSDFIVGKQTNFNGPVTIINCPTHPDPPTPLTSLQDTNERVVIKDKVLTASAASTVHSHAEKHKMAACSTKPVSPSGLPFMHVLLTKNFMKIPLLAWTVGSIVILACVVVVAVQLTMTKKDSNLDEGIAKDITLNGTDGSHRLLSKKEWGGLDPYSTTNVTSPTSYVVISHSAGRICYELETCIRTVRDIQRDHMSRDPPFADVAYNFLVGGDGRIYEGRGFDASNPITDDEFKSNNIDINFMGDFSDLEVPTYPQEEGVKALIQYGIMLGKIADNYTILAANSTYATDSPGKNVYKVIKTWPNFEPRPLPRS